MVKCGKCTSLHGKLSLENVPACMENCPWFSMYLEYSDDFCPWKIVRILPGKFTMVKHGTLSLVFHAGWSIRTTFVHVPGRLMLENMPSFPGLIFQQDWYSMDHISDQPTRLT